MSATHPSSRFATARPMLGVCQKVDWWFGTRLIVTVDGSRLPSVAALSALAASSSAAGRLGSVSQEFPQPEHGIWLGSSFDDPQASTSRDDAKKSVRPMSDGSLGGLYGTGRSILERSSSWDPCVAMADIKRPPCRLPLPSFTCERKFQAPAAERTRGRAPSASMPGAGERRIARGSA